MPFQEKLAWFTLVSAVIVYGVFATVVLVTPVREQTVLRLVVAFTIALTVQGVIVAIAKPLLALRDPGEARAPLDERDLIVARGAYKAAYLTLMGAVVILALAASYADAAWQITLSAYVATIVSDMVRMGATIANYRRRHG